MTTMKEKEIKLNIHFWLTADIKALNWLISLFTVIAYFLKSYLKTFTKINVGLEGRGDSITSTKKSSRN